ncbi:MAG: cation-transporting P-type ATPase [Actinobacteria bacterium]|nr:cation-transporting P-type ATPase [Actinomycetota bacterium]
MSTQPIKRQDKRPAWHTLDPDQVARALETDLDTGLSTAAAQRVLQAHGPNTLPSVKPPSTWQVIAKQLADPMNIMLIVVAVVGIIAGQPETAALVIFLVLLNLSLGTRQELKAQESVDALSSMQVPDARVWRDSQVQLIPAMDVVPGDVLMLEPGDLVPADGRIVRSASLETVESGLTGESAPLNKGPETLSDPETALGDRANLVFQNTSVTRGTATVIVTSTGQDTEMGKIAGMLSEVKSEQSPLQKEMRTLTIRLAILAWAAVAVIVAIGLARGLPANQIVLLGITVAISSIPSGLPTFLTAMLSYGSQRLAKAKAVVKNLTDVEALGSTSAINSDKTGTLTMDMMTATRMFDSGSWFKIEGAGYEKSGAILAVAGQPLPDFTPLALGLTLCSDATVSDDGSVVGDPTEAALVVLAAKMGVDAESSRNQYPRAAEVPFDSEYKFMATFHEAVLDGRSVLVELVKGAPDVILERCTRATWGEEELPIEGLADRIRDANLEMGRQGLRVMSFAYREFSPDDLDTVAADPMAAVGDLTFVALVGIIDPLRPTAKHAVEVALKAGIDVRMITGDHAVTAEAIAAQLGLGPGVITGPQFQRLSDEQLLEELPELHVFGRVAPEDKLRLVSVMQEAGDIVAMTGDAVNDAAALKKADIGVAMGSGSEVTKQAAKMILTDNNFATLVHAIELGRDIYGKITAQIRYVMAGLFGVLLIMLLASALNINEGQALNPVQLIFVTFVIGLFPAIGISTDSTEPGIMDIGPRDPKVPILNRTTAPRWFFYGLVQAVISLLPFAIVSAPENPQGASVPQSMTFGVLAVSTILLAASVRRGIIPGWNGPYLPYFLWLLIPAFLTWICLDWEAMHRIIDTTTLTGGQWLVVIGLSLILPIVIEIDKGIRRASGVRHSA